MCNPKMPKGSQHLALTSKIPNTTVAGFLYPGSEKNKGLFIFEKPTGEGRSSGPIKTGDTVVLRIYNSAKPSEERYVMKGGYQGEDATIAGKINQVPAFTPRASLRRVDITEKIFKFRIVMGRSWYISQESPY
jgi:hypothetical protein